MVNVDIDDPDFAAERKLDAAATCVIHKGYAAGALSRVVARRLTQSISEAIIDGNAPIGDRHRSDSSVRVLMNRRRKVSLWKPT